MKSTALALCYSSAEYACPVWERSTHAKKVDPALNASCRLITGCLRPTTTDSTYILAGIAPPDVRRHVTSMRERQRQVEDERHPLFNQVPATNRLRSRRSFLNSVNPLSSSSKGTRISKWEERLSSLPPEKAMALKPKEELPPGSDTKWTVWKCPNRLRTGVGRSKETLNRWGYLDNSQDLKCKCGTTPKQCTIC